MERMWINQPDVNDPFYDHHGENVLYDRAGGTIHYLKGPVKTSYISGIDILSEGWVPDANPAEVIESKTKYAIRLYTEGKIKEALKIASKFRLGVTADEAAILKRGFECFNYGQTYYMMGYNPEVCIRQASELFKKLYIN